MKRINKIFLLAFMLLIMVGCSKPSPTAVVQKGIDSMQKEYIDKFTAEMSSQEHSEKEISTYKQLGKMLKQQTFSLDNEKIDGDKATVDAHFKTYDFLSSFGGTLSRYIGQAFSLALMGATEQQMQDKLFELWNEDLIELEKQGVSRNFDYTFNLEKTEEGWKVVNLDDNTFVDGFLGGLLSAFERLSNQ